MVSRNPDIAPPKEAWNDSIQRKYRNTRCGLWCKVDGVHPKLVSMEYPEPLEGFDGPASTKSYVFFFAMVSYTAAQEAMGGSQPSTVGLH